MVIPHVAKFLLWVGGWTSVGQVPNVRKAVIIGAPHTSNWDGFWGLVYKVSIGLDIRFFVKESMFWFPLSLLLRGLGGIPLNRDAAASAVRDAVARFNNNETFYFGLAPEGTRRKTRGWKSGFYRIAEDAGVPVSLGFFDYANKRVGLGPLLTLTGDVDADLEIIESFYASIEACWPESASAVTFARERSRGERR